MISWSHLPCLLSVEVVAGQLQRKEVAEEGVAEVGIVVEEEEEEGEIIPTAVGEAVVGEIEALIQTLEGFRIQMWGGT